MRFVAIKSAKQQGQLMQHRARDLLIRQRTQLINALRAHLAELGIAAAQGRAGIKEFVTLIVDDGDQSLPVDARASLMVLAAQLQAVQTMIGSIEKRIVKQHRSNKESKRLQTIPGIGVIGASTITAVMPDPTVFRSGRDFAAWIGIVPRQDSTGGKQRLGSISKQGDRYLRRILVVGAHSWRGDRSRSLRSRSPTRWPASPGRCWPRVEPTGRLGSRLRKARLGNESKRLCWCVHELQG
jgi:transposase